MAGKTPDQRGGEQGKSSKREALKDFARMAADSPRAVLAHWKQRRNSEIKRPRQRSTATRMRKLLFDHDGRVPNSADPGPVRAAVRQLEQESRPEDQPPSVNSASAPASRTRDAEAPLTRQQAVTSLVPATMTRRAAVAGIQTPIAASSDGSPPPPVDDRMQSQVQPQTQPQTQLQSNASQIIQFPDTDQSRFQLQTRPQIQPQQPQSQIRSRPQAQFEVAVDQPQLEHCEDAEQNPEPVVQAAPQIQSISDIPLAQLRRTPLDNIQEEDTEPLTIDQVISRVEPTNTKSSVNQAAPPASPPLTSASPAYSGQQRTVPFIPSTPTSATNAQAQAQTQAQTQGLTYTGEQAMANVLTYDQIGDTLIGDANRFAGEEVTPTSNTRFDEDNISSPDFDPEHGEEHELFRADRYSPVKISSRRVDEFDSDDENAHGGQTVLAGTQGQPRPAQQAEPGISGPAPLFRVGSGSPDNREYHERGRSDGTMTSAIITDTTPRVNTDDLEEPQEQAHDEAQQAAQQEAEQEVQQEDQQEAGQEARHDSREEEQRREQDIEDMPLAHMLHLGNQV